MRASSLAGWRLSAYRINWLGIGLLALILYNPLINKKSNSSNHGRDKSLSAANITRLGNFEKILVPQWQQVTVEAGQTLGQILQAYGVKPKTALAMVESSPYAEKLNCIYPQQKIYLSLDKDNTLKAFKIALDKKNYLHIHATQSGFTYSMVEKPTYKRLNMRSSVIKDSLFLAARGAGLDQKLILQLADIFAWDIDFAQDVRENDSFRVLFEEEYLDNQRINTGSIIAAEFVNQGKAYRAVRYTDLQGKHGYYSPEGFSLQRAFMRNPVKFKRISSGFTLGRKHPILHTIRAHKGVDYVAPHGTPVKTVGDGIVQEIANKGGYGKTIVIRHGQGYATLYAHLAKFADNLKVGSLVKQGQVIGNVGRTGLATGDHLHFEFLINGIHRDPLTVNLPQQTPIGSDELSSFKRHSEPLLALLEQADTGTLLAKNTN